MATRFIIDCKNVGMTEFNSQIHAVMNWIAVNITPKSKLLGCELCFYGPSAFMAGSRRAPQHTITFVDDNDAILFRLAHDFDGIWTTEELKVKPRLKDANEA